MSVLIAGYARTPFVRYNGVFANVAATALGTHAVSAALERAAISPAEVNFVYAGQVVQAATGQNPARQSAVAAGIPLTVPAMTLNAVCLSGMQAVAAGARLIEDGDADVVVAVGQESMSRAPHAWAGSRVGKKYGAIELVDTLEMDGLSDAFERTSMGASTENFNDPLGLTRERQDAWSAQSHQRLAASAGFLAGEIAPYELRARAGATIYDTDDGLRAETTVETLARLSPAFSPNGTITAGNSSQLTDGAAAIVLVSERYRLRVDPIARLVAQAFVAGPDVSLHSQPANAILAAIAKTSLSPGDLAAIEINEAFAAVAVHSTRVLGVDPAIVNSHGGAIALGHPIGASGTRIVGTLARQLAALGPGSFGAAAICGGGGQGSAILLEAL
jgi:acetyl-CoA C-acetyltransferase